MAHFDYEKPGGVWGLFALLSSAIVQRFDKKIFKAINGDEGGTWAPANPTVGGPASPITVGGDGVQVFGPFLATDAQVTITSGKFLTLNSNATFTANVGSFTYLKGTVSLRNQMDVSVAGPNIGSILFEANTYLQIKQNAQLLVESGGILDLKPGALGYIEPGAVVEITGSAISAPNLQFGSYGTANFGGNAYCWIGALGEFRIKDHGAGFVDALGTFKVYGTLTLKGGASFTSEATSVITLAGATFNGPIERSGVDGVDIWRTQNLPAPASAGTTVAVNGQSKDRFVLDLSTNNGIDYALTSVGVIDDIRCMFVLPRNAWTGGARIVANGGQVLCAFRTHPDVNVPSSVVLYKSGGLWSVESWSGVLGTGAGTSISFP